MSTMLVRYLRFKDGTEEHVEITKDGLKLVFPMSELKHIVRQHELFIEREAAKKPIKKCTECKYCVRADEGYSNWTVEGTTVDCLLGLNKNLPKDEFYGEEDALLFASECKMYVEGEGPYLDVEREDFDREDYDAEILTLFDAWEIRQAAK